MVLTLRDKYNIYHMVATLWMLKFIPNETLCNVLDDLDIQYVDIQSFHTAPPLDGPSLLQSESLQ